jgi:putative ABC transport system permease protein
MNASAISMTYPSRIAVLQAAAIGPLRQGPGRTLLAVVAIALGVALGFSVYLINRVAAEEVQLASRSLFGMADLSVRAPGAGFDEALYPELAAVEGVVAASPVVEARARLIDEDTSLRIVGLDPFRAARFYPALTAAADRDSGTGRGLLEDAVWLSPAAAQQLGLVAGDELKIQVGLDAVVLNVAGLLPAGGYRQPLGVVDIATAQWRLRQLGRLNRVDLRLRPGIDAAAVRERIEEIVPPGAVLETPGQASDDAVRLSRAYRSNLTALALVALFTGAFLVYATQTLAVTRRRREIALLHAIGMTVREQLVAFLVSGALVGAAGSALGVLLGIVVARAGVAAFGADLGAGYFEDITPHLEVGVTASLVFFMLGVTTAIVATLGPAREAATVPAAAALKSGDQAPVQTRRHGWVAAALLLASLAALALPPIDGIALPGYASIACLLLAAVFLTPALAARVFDRLPLAGPAWQQVAVAQLRGTAQRSTVSIAAVLVSFSLMVAMAIMVYSFRESLDDWMHRILPADVFVRAGSSSHTGFIDAEAQAALRDVEGVSRADFVRFQEVMLAGEGLPLTLIARPINEETAAKVLPLRRTDPHPAPGDAVPVWASEAALDLRGLDVGSVFELPLGGRNVRASVRGLWRDYERPGGALVIPRSEFVRYTGDDRATTAALWVAADAAPEVVATAIRDALRRDGRYDVALPGEIRRRSLQVFDRTFAVTYLLEAVAVLIGLFGVSASMSSQVLARRGEFGMLRYLGVTKREVARMLGFEGALLGTVGVLAGLVVGSVVSLILIYVVNRQSFHWTMDLHVPWPLLGILSGTLILASAAVAAFSGRAAMGPDVVRAVKEDW